MLAVYCLCYSYSYSETVIGSTQNAASSGLSWVMTNILPQAAGLTVGAVRYSYTTVKLPSDPLLVTVENAHSKTSGYIFRSQDDWTGLPGNTLVKTVPVNNIPGSLWGPGSITATGTGSVENPQVNYSFRYDTCFGTTSTDPSCLNYKSPTLSNNYTESTLTPQEFKVWEQPEEERVYAQRLLQAEQTKKPQALKSSNTNLLANYATAASLFAQNNLPGITQYSRAIPGGVYLETVKLRDSRLPDSRNSARISFSQERLHTRMVDQQYNRGIKND